MKLTKNFTLEEFKCKDGTYPSGTALKNTEELAKNLQVLRDHIGKPIYINSGYRTIKHNEKVGGAKFSQHLIGKAADIVVKGMTPREVYLAIEELFSNNKMKLGGLTEYSTFVHYDIRGYRAKW